MAFEEEVKIVPGTEGNFRRSKSTASEDDMSESDWTGLSTYNDENGINSGDLSKSLRRREKK